MTAARNTRNQGWRPTLKNRISDHPEVHRRLLEEANAAVDRVALSTPLTVFMFAALLWPYGAHTTLILWGLFVNAVVGIQMWARRPRKVQGSAGDSPQYQRRSWPNRQLAIAGAAWGSLPIVGLQAPAPREATGIAAMIGVALLASGPVFAASSRRLFLNFQCAAVTALEIGILRSGGTFGRLLGFFIFYCFVVSLFLHTESHQRIIDATEKGYENECLSAQLEDKSRGLEERNVELHNINGRLEVQALSDQLTGLANRRVLRRDLEELLSTDSNAVVGVILIDIDRFKQVNNALGSELADQLLINVSRCILENVRAGDLVSRNGGDEFTVLVVNPRSNNELYSIAESIRRAVADGFDLNRRRWQTSVSIGITMAKGGRRTVAALLQEADVALLRAKELGRNRVERFHGDLHATVIREQQRGDELRRALSAGEIIGWLQPEVSLLDGRMRRAELLARWQHPVEGVLGADRFISDIDHHRLHPQLASATALAAIATVRALEPHVESDFRLHVNVSTHLIGQMAWVERFLALLDQNNVSTTRFTMEITETAVIEDFGRASAWVKSARDAGITVFLDDFGVGYSSLSMLTNLQVDGLKIDKSFVNEFMSEPAARAVIKATSSIAADLGLTVIAEGVEKREQAQALLDLGIFNAQGYLFSPAVSVDDMVRWQTQGTPWRGRYDPQLLSHCRQLA